MIDISTTLNRYKSDNLDLTIPNTEFFTQKKSSGIESGKNHNENIFFTHKMSTINHTLKGSKARNSNIKRRMSNRPLKQFKNELRSLFTNRKINSINSYVTLDI